MVIRPSAIELWPNAIKNNAEESYYYSLPIKPNHVLCPKLDWPDTNGL